MFSLRQLLRKFVIEHRHSVALKQYCCGIFWATLHQINFFTPNSNAENSHIMFAITPHSRFPVIPRNKADAKSYRCFLQTGGRSTKSHLCLCMSLTHTHSFTPGLQYLSPHQMTNCLAASCRPACGSEITTQQLPDINMTHPFCCAPRAF